MRLAQPQPGNRIAVHREEIALVSRIGALAALGLACAHAPAPAPAPAFAPITDCEAVGRARPICGFQNPEDLALLPDGRTLLVSEYGGLDGERPGDLASFDTESEVRHVLFRGGDADAARPRPGWGDAACPGPPSSAFSPHGIHLSRREDGVWQLLAVQHGGRESIELFEIALDSDGAPRALWRGCVIPPAGAYLNDVVALPGGGLATTHMLPRNQGAAGVLEGFGATASGYVLEWQPASGFRRVPHSEAAIANGIERSPDGSVLYVNASAGGEVFALERASGRVLWRVPVPLPDNSTWAPDGRLIVASLVGGFSGTNICQTIGGRACPAEFQLVALDPATHQTEVLFRSAGPPMGAATVGLRVGNAIYAGSFTGDRLLRIALD
jgi:hypothetical protein